MIRSYFAPLTLCVATLLTGCEKWPGKDGKPDTWHFIGEPKEENRWHPPSELADPVKLYNLNCVACHSIGATTSASIALDSQTYLAVLPPEKLKDIIVNGIPGSRMPAFSEAKGGGLNDMQVDKIVEYILQHKKPVAGPLPPYAAPPGDAAAGQGVFLTYCATCHGMDGTGIKGKAGSVVDPAYLGLVTDQYLRTVVIAGRPELGFPDYRSRVSGQAMTDQEISDVTAWLVSHRRTDLGQPITQSMPQPAAQPTAPPLTTPNP